MFEFSDFIDKIYAILVLKWVLLGIRE